jgi:hypothetical protein
MEGANGRKRPPRLEEKFEEENLPPCPLATKFAHVIISSTTTLEV